MHDDDPLTPAELAFRALMQNPRAWSAWCATVRAQWRARQVAAGVAFDATKKPAQRTHSPASKKSST